MARGQGREQGVRLTAVAALVGVAAWVVKWAAIAVQGASGSPVDVAAFFVGLVGIVVGAASLGLRATRGRGPGATAGACVAAAVVAVLLVGVLTTVSSALFGDGTVAGGEAGLVVLALAALAVGVTGLRRRRVAAA